MLTSKLNLFGVHIDLLSIPELNSLIGLAVDTNRKWIIANHNLHSLYLYYHDYLMRAFYARADYAHADGMALIFLGKLFRYPVNRSQRVTYADWIWPLASDAAEKGWRIFYLGSKPGVAERGASILRDKYHNLQITTHHGYFDKDIGSLESKAVLDMINSYSPNILMVGMGMPLQEKWVIENLDSIEANVILNSGACLDYVAGAVPTPPRWLGRIGLEWLYRLISEPRRLWKRYLLEPMFLLKLMVVGPNK